MKHADKNRDQAKAQKRALADFRCSVKKFVAEAHAAKMPVSASGIHIYPESNESVVGRVRMAAADGSGTEERPDGVSHLKAEGGKA